MGRKRATGGASTSVHDIDSGGHARQAGPKEADAPNMTAFDRIMTTFDRIMTAFDRIMTAFDRIMTQ